MFVSQAGGSDDTVMRYSSQYEERLDPFASFSRKVSESQLMTHLRAIHSNAVFIKIWFSILGLAAQRRARKTPL